MGVVTLCGIASGLMVGNVTAIVIFQNSSAQSKCIRMGGELSMTMQYSKTIRSQHSHGCVVYLFAVIHTCSY